MPTTDLEENKIKQAQPEEGNDTAQNEREIRKNIFKNERVNFILGVILVIFSLYLTISFISFFFTGSIDQSKVENLSVGELSSIGNEIQNWTGAFGAYLSNLMINRWMGICFHRFSMVICRRPSIHESRPYSNDTIYD